MNTTLRALCFTLLVFAGCGKPEPERPDHPRLTPSVQMRDVVFRSSSLNRDIRYRAILPSSPPATPMPVVYLLHGSGEDFRSWSNYSDVARFAEKGLILIMPQGDYSYYVNAADPPEDRYEDYITRDLIADVEAKFPAANDRAHRAIVGVSMGGFGAINLGLHHPGLYHFVGAFSPAVDVPRREFSVRRLQQSMAFRSLFGTGAARQQNDPFVAVQRANPSEVPYFFLTVGESESLLPPNREFAAILKKRGLPHEFHIVPGGHDWRQWNNQLPSVFDRLMLTQRVVLPQ